MGVFWDTITAALIVAMGTTAAQTQASGEASNEPVAVFTEHPRLLLRPARLRLLRRERERSSPRWRQFESLVTGGAPMPEPGFANALYYQISGSKEAGQRAVNWALGPVTDLRQLSFVFDWCQDVLSETQSTALAARIASALAASAADESIPAVRSRALAAIALYDHTPDVPKQALEQIVHAWWTKTARQFNAGRAAIPRDDAYALYELLHTIRDNTNLDLRLACPKYFRIFPHEHLMSYYPALYEAPENDFRIGLQRAPGEPDLRLAALSRAAGLAMVAFDSNAQESQDLQGWLMHDRFALRGPFGAPYEFLWANPYQPGLGYFHVPLAFHDAETGQLFLRSSWEDDAKWFGYSGGIAQVFENGRLGMVDARTSAPLQLAGSLVCFGQAARKFKAKLDEPGTAYLTGLEPRLVYQVEVDDEEVYEAPADPGGILEVSVPAGETGVRIREAPGR
jgi:hypothetical protein